MSYKKDLSYHNIPFSSETPQEDFFLHDVVSSLYTKCENSKNKVMRVRTVGILKNKHGCFYIKEIITAHNPSSPLDLRQSIQVSLANLNKALGCSSMPYPVQLFGTLQWCSRPIIFAQIIQPLSASVATSLCEILGRVSTFQSSKHLIESHEFDNYD